MALWRYPGIPPEHRHLHCNPSCVRIDLCPCRHRQGHEQFCFWLAVFFCVNPCALPTLRLFFLKPSQKGHLYYHGFCLLDCNFSQLGTTVWMCLDETRFFWGASNSCAFLDLLLGWTCFEVVLMGSPVSGIQVWPGWHINIYYSIYIHDIYNLSFFHGACISGLSVKSSRLATWLLLLAYRRMDPCLHCLKRWNVMTRFQTFVVPQHRGIRFRFRYRNLWGQVSKAPAPQLNTAACQWLKRRRGKHNANKTDPFLRNQWIRQNWTALS